MPLTPFWNSTISPRARCRGHNARDAIADRQNLPDFGHFGHYAEIGDFFFKYDEFPMREYPFRLPPFAS